MTLPTRGKRQQAESKPRPPDSHVILTMIESSLFAYSTRTILLEHLILTSCLEKVLSSACVWGAESGVWADVGCAVLAAHWFSSPPPPLLCPWGKQGHSRGSPTVLASLRIWQWHTRPECPIAGGSCRAVPEAPGARQLVGMAAHSCCLPRKQKRPKSPRVIQHSGTAEGRYISHWMQGGFPSLGCKMPCHGRCSWLCLSAASAGMRRAPPCPHSCHTTPAPRGSSSFTYFACGSIFFSGWRRALST